MASNAKRMWLHDENGNIIVLPYTTLDNIKIQSDLTEDNFTNFEDDYNNVKTIIANNKNSSDTAIRRVENEIDQLEIQVQSLTEDTATITSNGLMAKEDKAKLNNIAEGANNYSLPPASTETLGGVKVDGTTTTIDNNGVLHAAGSGGGGSIETLSDVELEELDNGQILQYDEIEEKWKNVSIIIPDGSLSSLSDIELQNLMNNQIIQYDTSLGKWVNKTLETDLQYVTPEQINSLFVLVPFNSATDEEIATMINAYYNGQISLEDVKSVWSIGDTRTLSINAITATGGENDTSWTVGEAHRAQDITIQILDFNHDDLTDGINGKTKALITVDLKNCLRAENTTDEGGSTNTENGYMNATMTNSTGWNNCARRAWCNNGFYNALPEYIQDLIKNVNKLTSAGNLSSTINTASDKIFFLSEVEVFGENDSNTYSFDGEGIQYKWYETQENRYKLPKYNGYGSPSNQWWTRSPDKGFNSSYRVTTSYGIADRSSANYNTGIAPAFCL